MADASLELSEWRDAIAELSAYKRLSGDRRADLDIARAEHASGKSSRALARLDEMRSGVRGTPAEREVLLLQARIYADRGDGDIARGLLESARRLHRG